MTIKRVCPGNDIFPIKRNCCYTAQGRLPCSWITHPAVSVEAPLVLGFRISFHLQQAETITLHVSADQQYILYLNGKEAGRGSDMKSPENWYFESYELSLNKGAHILDALVWNWGALSPMNRMSLKPGFILIPDERHLATCGTGLALWKVTRIRGVGFEPLRIVKGAWMGIPPYQKTDFNEWNWAPGEDMPNAEWASPVIAEWGRNGALPSENGGRLLRPSLIRQWVHREIRSPQAVYVADRLSENGYVAPDENQTRAAASLNFHLNRTPLIIPGKSQKRILFALDNYYCAYPRLTVCHGKRARLRLSWAEALYTGPEEPAKGRRTEWQGRYFRGVWDEFILDGAPRELSSLAWRCGRYLELQIETDAEPLCLDTLTLMETRYPMEMEVAVSCDDPAVNAIVPLCFRTLQMCAHEAFVDCPFYEQLLYAGDNRLQALVNLVAMRDDTLPRKAILLLDASRDNSGFTMARWPSRCRQVIPSFSLWWIGMVYDYALWRGDKPFIASFLPGVRHVLDRFLDRRDPDGFVRGRAGEWNFIDWVDAWHKGDEYGTPPGITQAVNATYNWLFVYILGLAQKLEGYAGDAFLAARWAAVAETLASRLIQRFWNSGKGLFQEDDTGRFFSEHAQVLAVLSERLRESHKTQLSRSLLSDSRLERCSIFYKHYLFEASAALHHPEKIISELGLWTHFLEQGFKTVPETPENKTFNQRSDCHGWGAHPIYHLIANIAGIQPAAMGFQEVRITPQLAGLNDLSAECVHPHGLVSLKATKTSEGVTLIANLPDKVSGRLVYDRHTEALKPGENTFHYS